jgi:hypothetical protein
LACVWVVILSNLIDLSHFFNKFILQIPGSHKILVFRVHLWGFMACISIREFYLFIIDNNIKRLGSHIWLSHLILIIEYMILFKFKEGIFI